MVLGVRVSARIASPRRPSHGVALLLQSCRKIITSLHSSGEQLCHLSGKFA